MGSFRWGIIGPGRIAHTFARGLEGVDGAKLYAVASNNAERGARFATQYGADVVYASYVELIDDPRVDAIYIATPHNFHFSLAQQCLQAGIPVLCEKPLTVTAAQTQRLIDCAQQHNTFLMEALWSRFLPAWCQLRKWLSAGVIGQVKMIQSTIAFPIERNVEGRLLNPALAGGAMLDIGVYSLSLSQFVMQESPDSLVINGMVGETGVDERVSGILGYADAASQFSCGFNFMGDNSAIIYGSEGNIRLSDRFWQTTSARLEQPHREPVIFDEPWRASGFEYQIEHTMQCINKGLLQSDVIPWADTLATQQLMDQILAQLGIYHHRHHLIESDTPSLLLGCLRPV